MKRNAEAASMPQGRILDTRLAAYLAAAGAAGSVMASEADAAIIANTTEQPFGINESIDIDFNNDGQVDFQVSHYRQPLNGTFVDYLQLDKNDIHRNTPLVIDNDATFPPNATVPNDPHVAGYVTNTSQLGHYPAALTAGTEIGPGSNFDWQETTSFDFTGRTMRANRLIDYDNTQFDQIVGGLDASQVQEPLGDPNFLGLGGEVRYLGVKMDLNSTGQINYGWIGVRIDNEAEATGAVVGYGYQTFPDVPIRAGEIPEPSSIVMAGLGALALVGVVALRWLRGR